MWQKPFHSNGKKIKDSKHTLMSMNCIVVTVEEETAMHGDSTTCCFIFLRPSHLGLNLLDPLKDTHLLHNFSGDSGTFCQVTKKRTLNPDMPDDQGPTR